MDMQQMQPGAMPQDGPPQAGGDPKAMLTQAKALIDKALAAMGGEEAGDGMSVEDAFGQGFQGDEVKPRY